jgi:hypothetical protein
MSANVAAADEPCPMCGSGEVRWRKRRWHDVVRTQARWFVETMLHSITGGGRTMSGGRVGWFRGAGDQMRDPRQHLAEERYLRSKAAFDSRISSKTPARFWACASCGREGHEFDGLTSMLEGREAIAEHEDALRAQGGTVVHPVDRDGLEPDR